MAQFPSLPLWTDAYLADTRHLTDAEHGIYIQLLMLMWRCPECRVPNDDLWLSRQLTRPEQAVVDGVRPLINEFCKTDGNWIWQGRLKDEWLYLKKRSSEQSGRAKARWAKDKPPCPTSTGKTNPAMPPTHTLPTPTPIESLFDEFWLFCPVKKGKQDAREQFEITLESVEFDVLLSGMQGYAAERNGEDQKYTLYPAAWLAQGRWTDESSDAPIETPESKAKDKAAAKKQRENLDRAAEWKKTMEERAKERFSVMEDNDGR